MKALFSEKEQLNVTLRSIGDGVIVTNNLGEVIIMNSVAESLTGWKEAEAAGKPLKIIFNIINEKTGKQCENPVKRVIKSLQVVNLEDHTMLISKSASHYIIADSAAPIFDSNESLSGVVMVFRDIKNEKKARDAFYKMKRLESVNLLAAGIAHDFNNILQGIMGNAEYLSKYGNLDEDLTESINDIFESSNRVKHLTNQLLLFSDESKPILKIYSVAQIIDTIYTEIIKSFSITIKINPQKNLQNLNVKVDIQQLNSVFNNILKNAEEAMPNGGKVTIYSSLIKLSELNEQNIHEGEYIILSIKDEGPGISDKNKDKIFNPYYSTKQSNSGFGLSTSFSIIKNHKGTITFKSAESNGTTFNIYLPLIQQNLLKTEKSIATKSDSNIPIKGEKNVPDPKNYTF